MSKRKKVILFLLILSVFVFIFTWLKSVESDTLYKRTAFHKVTPTKYEENILWPKNKEEKNLAGEASGVAVNSKGDIYYLHRANSTYGGKQLISENTVVVIDGKTKRVKDTWGKSQFQSPHGLEIDNQDNVWITDITQNKVYKFSSQGDLLSSYGSTYPFYMEWALRIRNEFPKFPIGMNKYTFARPTDVTVCNDGSFIVSDGYRNHRIVKFDKKGKFLWEKNSLGNGPEQFNLPHGISQDKEGNIYVADRNNARIEVLDKNGNYLTSWDQSSLGRPFGVEVAENGKIYVVDGGNSLYPKHGKGSNQVIVLNKEGNIVERFGMWGNKKGELKVPHDIAVDKKGNIYVAELGNKRLQEFHIK